MRSLALQGSELLDLELSEHFYPMLVLGPGVTAVTTTDSQTLKFQRKEAKQNGMIEKGLQEQWGGNFSWGGQGFLH